MYLDRPTLRALREISFSGIRGGRRFFFVSQGIFHGVRALIAVGRRLDDFFYPEYAQQEIQQPVFIFAPPRSGTTWLHRLLSLDEARFTHLRLYQTLLQSVTLTRVAERVARWDGPLRGALSRALSRADVAFFGGWKDIHPMGLNQAEEDEGFLVFTLLSPGAFVFYPWVRELPRAAWLDDVEEPTRRTVMAEYRASVQRHLFADGEGRTWLNKTVLLASRAQAVTDTFPDARFICVVRNPYETVPSFVSMFTTFWRSFYPDLTLESELAQRVAQLAVDYTQKTLEMRHRIGPERFHVVRYDDLVADPQRVVEDIYRHFGWDLSASFRRRLADQIAVARGYRPRHEYSLERFGITRRSIYEQLRPFFEEFGFDPQLDDDLHDLEPSVGEGPGGEPPEDFEDDTIEDDALDPIEEDPRET